MISRKSQGGFGLIEILVATVVLALGMLGIGSLQLNTLRNNHSSSFRSQATILTYDIVDAMRANRTTALAGEYDILFTELAPTGSTLPEKDIRNWFGNLAEELPQSDGQIVRNGSEFTISVSWDDSRGQNNNQIFSITTML